MTEPHDVLEHLSAYLDGELDAAERARIEAHLAACPSCREVESALRATLSDFEAMPEPEPSAQDQWALRAAINRARKGAQPSRWQRWAVGSGAAAAALALIVSVAVLNDGDGASRDDRAFSSGPAAGTFESAGVPQVELLDGSFSEETARALLEQPSIAADAMVAGSPEDGAAARSAQAAPEEKTGRISLCEGELFGADQETRIPIRYIAADYKDVPAFFLLYQLPDRDRTELWVIAQNACMNVLFFAQSDA